MTDNDPNNGVLAVKLDYIQKDISTIKADVKEIKADFISRREFETQMKDIDAKFTAAIKVNEDKTVFISRIVYSVISVLAMATLTAIIKGIYK